MRIGSEHGHARWRQGVLAAGLAAGVLACPMALAQDRPAASESVEPPGGQMATSGRETGLVIDQVESPGAEGSARLSTKDAPVIASQIYRDGPTAEPSTPLSRPAEGREASAAPLGGSDRCDEARAARSKLCAQAIEKRAEEFESPSPAMLSPEQRLLVDQRLRAGPRTVTSAAQRIGSSEIDVNSADAQGLASIVLPKPGEPARATGANADPTDPAPADAAGAALIQAIVERMQTSPQ